MKVYNYEDFYKLLKQAKKPIAFVSMKEPYDSLQVAPVGCFGSYSIMPEVDDMYFDGEDYQYDYPCYDTAFETDFDKDDKFAVLGEHEIKQAIKILSYALNQKIIYRPHRELLEEAMEEARVFDSKEEMIDYIVKKENESAKSWGIDKFFDKEDVYIKDDPVNDTRIGWEDTRYVCTRRYFRDVGTYVLGMCATIFPGNK